MTSIRRPAGNAREWTGLRVLLCLLAFFGVVAAANGMLVHYALSTFGGVETENAYAAGLRYQADIDAAARQRALGWQVATEVVTLEGGLRELQLRPLDARGVPLRSLGVEATLRHPIDSRQDMPLTFTEVGLGVYAADANAAPGQWELDIALLESGEPRFRSKNRLILK